MGEVAAQVGENSANGIASAKVTLALAGTLDRLSAANAPTSSFFNDSGAREPVFGAGDVLAITVIEQVTGGLFSASNVAATEHGANVITLPGVQIDGKGMISVPYLGSVMAAGLTETTLGEILTQGLEAKTPSPVVMVRRTLDMSNTVLVTGIAGTSGPVQLTPARETLIDVIARAGGSQMQPSDTLLRMTRQGQTRSIRLSALQQEPRLDIAMQRGDVVSLESAVQRYTVLGAALVEASRPLPPSGTSLAEAIGDSGGLNDTRADDQGVYVLRYESRSTLAALGVKAPPNTPPNTPATAPATGEVPMLYQFDMGSVDGIFAAQAFDLRANDVVLVANAQGVGLTKALQLFSNAAQSVSTAQIISDRARTR